jgi:PTS system galactitol-specific IIC component
MFVLIIPMVNGNGFRALITGIITIATGLLIATNLSPLITTAAVNAKFKMPEGAMAISSICDGANPLTWLIVHLNDLGVIGVSLLTVIAIILLILNRTRIIKEAKEIHSLKDDTGI